MLGFQAFLLLAALLFAPGWRLPFLQETPQPEVWIQSPLPGRPLQGKVLVSGSSAVAGFGSAELSFAYSDDPTGAWFLIAESGEAVQEGPLAEWDTTTISDGVYTLRLVVTAVDGSQHTAVVPHLRVRNYSSIETDTPTPPPPTATSLSGGTAGLIPSIALPPSPTSFRQAENRPTGTPLPPNPAQLSTLDIQAALGKGALSVLGVFALLGFYGSVNRLLRRR